MTQTGVLFNFTLLNPIWQEGLPMVGLDLPNDLGI